MLECALNLLSRVMSHGSVKTVRKTQPVSYARTASTVQTIKGTGSGSKRMLVAAVTVVILMRGKNQVSVGITKDLHHQLMRFWQPCLITSNNQHLLASKVCLRTLSTYCSACNKERNEPSSSKSTTQSLSTSTSNAKLSHQTDFSFQKP